MESDGPSGPSEELAEISNEEILREVPLLALLGDGLIKRVAEQMQVESLGERFERFGGIDQEGESG